MNMPNPQHPLHRPAVVRAGALRGLAAPALSRQAMACALALAALGAGSAARAQTGLVASGLATERSDAGTTATANEPAGEAPATALSLLPQPLAQSLNALSRRFGVAIGGEASLLEGRMAPAVEGTLTLNQALARVLAGSGLTATRQGGAIVIQRGGAASGGVTTLPQVTATARTLQESATGPVNGYIARRSATGTKTDTAIMETPLSVHVIAREQIEQQGAQRITQALRYTPGLSTDIRGDISRFDMLAFRGTGAVADTFQYLDGLRLPRGASYLIPQIDPYNLERVEVLKGPASVLYGQAPLGGIINLVSKRPTEESFGEVMVAAGSHRRRQAGFDGSGALNDDGTLRYRLTLLGRKADTSVTLTEEERWSIAPSITWQPNADTSLTLLSVYQQDPTGGFYGVLPSKGTILPNPNGRIARDFFDGSPDFNDFERTQAAIGYEFRHRFNPRWQVRQNLRYSRTELDQNQIGTLSLQADNRTLNRYSLWSSERLNGISIDTMIEGQLETGALRHQVAVGVDVQRDHWTQTQGMGAAPTLDLFAPDYSQPIVQPAATSSPDRTQRLLGLYVQDHIKYANWGLMLGGRVDRARIRNDNRLTGIDARQSFTKSTWRAGLIHNFDNGVAPYASYATSFDPSVTANPYGTPFKPTTGRQYEVGVKFQPASIDGLFTVSVFDLTQQNVLTRDPTSPLPNAQVQTGEVNSRGLELEAKFSPAEGFNLVAGLTTMNPKVTKSNGVDRGKRPVSVARTAVSLWADYQWQGGPLDGLTLGAGVRRVGGAYADAANTQKIPHYAVADAMLHYELGRLSPSLKGTSVALNVSNLTDKVYFTCNMADFCNYGQGRTFLATLKYGW